MMHKAWGSIEEVPYCFARSHSSKKSSYLTQIGRFRIVTPVSINQCLWNIAQSLKQQRRDALLFSKVIHQISRSHRTKHHRFWPKLGVSRLLASRSFQIPQIWLVKPRPLRLKGYCRHLRLSVPIILGNMITQSVYPVNPPNLQL